MVKITFSDEFGKSMDLQLSDDSLRMITRFLHFICFADHSLYDCAAPLKKAVSDFYDSEYSKSQIQDSKILKYCIDYIIGNLA